MIMKNMIPLPVKPKSWGFKPEFYIKEFLVGDGVMVDEGPCHVDADIDKKTFEVGIRERRGRGKLKNVFARGTMAGEMEPNNTKSISIAFTTPGWAEKIENGCNLKGSEEFVNKLEKFAHIKKADKKAVRQLFEEFAITAATQNNTEFCDDWCVEAISDDYSTYCSR